MPDTPSLALAALALALSAPSGDAPGPAGAAGAPGPASGAPALRLPAGVRPLRADLSLTVDPAAERHSGTVRYQVELDAPASVVWLHAEGLEIARATVGGRAAATVTAEGGLLGLRVDPPAAAGAQVVELEFSGTVDRVRSRGLYAAPEEDGRWYAYTFFEPTDARRAFPCFDEPTFKHPWRLVLRVPEGNVALANAPAKAEASEAGWRRVTFAETLPLPSYLVALVVGPFELVDAGAGGAARIPIRIAVPRGRAAEARHAAGALPRLLDALEGVIGLAYPYPKCDVAVPPRFWGTMEHPGLVALGQPLILIRPGEETRERRQRLVTIALHELAHHWYGDLVTPAWWDDTWLNEAFATWEDAVAAGVVEPGWRVPEEARWERRAAALSADALPSARRLREPVRSRHEIEGAFDAEITYDKGAAVISAFEAFVGPERWRAVVRSHLAARAHATATAGDFLAALEAGAGAPVAGAFRGFLDRPGFPLLESRVRCGPGGARVSVRQGRFLATGAGAGPAPGGWTVPLCLRAGDARREVTACALTGPDRGEVALPFCPDWVWTNAGGTGYWLSALVPGEPARLLPRLSPAERLALATDAALLARRGDLPVEEALGLVAPLAREADRLQVAAALRLGELAQPDRLGERDLSRWRAWLRRTHGPRARALGWLPRPDDDEEARALRRLLVPLVAAEGREAVLAGEAQALALRWLADRSQVPAEVAWPALEAAAAVGARDLFDRIAAEAARAADRAERERLLGLLGAFQDRALTEAALALVLAEGADLRDTAAILRSALRTREGRDAAWDFLRRRWDELAARLRSDEAGWLVEAAALAACEPRRRAEVAAFLGPRAGAFDGAPAALADGLAEADACLAARARHGAAVSRFLARAGGAAPVSAAAPAAPTPAP